MNIGIIGAGRVGVSFGKVLCEHNLLSGFYSDVYPDFEYRIFKTQEELCENSDIIFITVPDGKISEVYNSIKVHCKEKIVCHMSGAMSAKDAFSDGEMVASLHPVMAVSSTDMQEEMKKAVYTVEGSSARVIKTVLNFLEIREIDSDKKALYHASCVFASNLIQGILDVSVDNLIKCGFNKSDALTALEKLTKTNIDSIFEKGIQDSLTGPVDRCDTETVKHHLDVLQGDDKQIYKLLTKKLIKIAEDKNNSDYTCMRKALN